MKTAMTTTMTTKTTMSVVMTTITTTHFCPEPFYLLLTRPIQKVRLVWMNCRTYNKGTGFDVVASK